MFQMYQPHPRMMAVVDHYDDNRKPVYKYLRWGAEVEEDPDRPAYCRLKQRKKGSPLRASVPSSYVALGLPNAAFPVTVPGAGTLPDISFTPAIQEDGFLYRLFMDGVPTTPTLFITNLQHRGDSLMSGNVSAKVFERDAVGSPIFGHFISENTALVISFRNTGAAPIDVAPSFSLL